MGETMYCKFFFLAFLAFFLGVCPDLALASGGITEFSGPLEKVVNTITGPAGKYISITAVGICGIIYLMNRDDVSGAFKMLLGVVAGISLITFEGSIVNSTVSFSGAVI